MGDQSAGVLVADLLQREVFAALIGGLEQLVELVDDRAPLGLVGDARGHGDGVGDVEGGVGAVADLEAQFVLTGAHVHRAVALASAEVHVVGVAGHGRAGFDAAAVDDDVEVSGALPRLAGLLDRHAVGGHRDAHAAEDGGAVGGSRERRRGTRGVVVITAAGDETDRAEQREDRQTAASQ